MSNTGSPAKAVGRNVKQELTAWIDQEERHKRTLEALADVDAGRLIDRQSIEAWVDRLTIEDPLSWV